MGLEPLVGGIPPSGCCRLHRRYERKAEHSLAFAGLAAALICYRRLGGRVPR